MKIAVLTSGGVDSSVALALLKEQGHDVTAFYLKIWLEDELSFLGDCPWSEDLEFVKKLCKNLDVELKIINLQKDYLKKVIGLAINQVKLGLTPNPDIFCNSFIKFGSFFEKIDLKTFDKVATGHYATLEESSTSKNIFLKESKDKVKDQTYFLAKLNQDQLKKIIFPVGEFEKAKIRELAEKFDVPAKERKDSQGLCFLGKIKFSDFLKANIGEKPGEILEFETNKMLGTHKGFWFFTIGQRRGINLSGGPWYVVKKDPEKNIIYISKKYFSLEKSRNSFFAKDLNWFNSSPNNGDKLFVKLRHGPEKHSCKISFIEKDKIKVELEERDQGISPGQFAVFYKDGFCLGSAMILEET